MDKLVVENLYKMYRKEGRNGCEVTALKDINFQIKDKEFAVIVGPSGCGKSTLLNIIGGLEYASGGKISIDGKEVSEPGADRGMVFQGYSLFPWLNIQKNVEFGLRIRGLSNKEKMNTAKKFIDMVGLTGFEKALPKTLSGGMKQRVAIARTLANSPSLLLMDEPFGALDAQTRMVLQESLSKIHKQSEITVLFITHDIEEALLLADKIYVMSSRPGCIKEVLDVPLKGERNHKTLLRTEFIDMKSKIMDMLWQQNEDINEQKID